MGTTQCTGPDATDRGPRSAFAGPLGRVTATGALGLLLAAGSLVGAGTASAADPRCPAPGKPIPTLLAAICKPVSSVASGAGSAVGSVGSTASSAASSAGGTVGGTASGAVTGAGRVVGGAASAVTGSGSASRSSGSSASSSGSAAAPRSTAAAAAPAAAPATAAAPVAAAPVAAAPTFTSAFDSLPASFLGSASAPGGLAAFAPAGGAYDPGLLFGAPGTGTLRGLAPNPVSTVSRAQPMTLGDGPGVGTPILLSVLAGAVMLALGIRSGVLRRARRAQAA